MDKRLAQLEAEIDADLKSTSRAKIAQQTEMVFSLCNCLDLERHRREKVTPELNPVRHRPTCRYRTEFLSIVGYLDQKADEALKKAVKEVTGSELEDYIAERAKHRRKPWGSNS